MLTITIPKSRNYDEEKKEFSEVPAVTLKMEHSLLSLRKWESKWHKSYLEAAEKGMTLAENVDYIRCMCIDPNVDTATIKRLTRKNYEDIIAYINDPMTATTVREQKGPPSRKIITAEVLYSMMIENGIPFECEKWHLNQLLMLIKVCGNRNIPQKKYTEQETAAMYNALNLARRKKTGSKG